MNLCEKLTINSLIGIGWFMVPDMMAAYHLKKNGHDTAAQVLAIAGVVGRMALYVLAVAAMVGGAAMAMATGAATPLAPAATPLGISALSLMILGNIGTIWMMLQFSALSGALLAAELKII